MRFSIIIPAYNAEAFLDRCLESIRSQSFPDYQVLIVDDGSRDGTLRIAVDSADRDSRFHLTQISHGGPGAARNRGLELARGEYILYMDADDYWLDAGLLQQLDDRIREHPTDVLMYRSLKVTEEGTVLRRYAKPPFDSPDAVLPLAEVYPDLVRDGQTLAAAWNKCVRRELLTENRIIFREDVFAEDIDWVLQLFSYVKTIRLLNLDAYAYTQHRGSSRSGHRDAANDLAEVVLDWAGRCSRENIAHAEAVAGLVAFEYGICMGSHHRLTPEKKRRMRHHQYLLKAGLDRKTNMICRFCGLFGYRLTCLAIRIYLILRRIW